MPSPPDSERRRWVILLGALSALGPLAIDMYLPTLPTIQRELATTQGAVQFTLSAYFVGLTVGQLVWGPVADRIGRKGPLVMGLGLYAMGSLLCAVAPRIELLALGRTVQAIGGSAGIVVVRAVVRDRWAGRQAAEVMSSIVLVMGAAPILAPTLGGLVLELAGWRTIFLLLAGSAAAVLVVLLRALPETKKPGTVEPVGRAAQQVLGDRRFVAYGLGSAFSQAGMFAYIAGSPFVFIDLLHLAPSTFALLFGANAAGYVLVSQLNRRLLKGRAHTTIATGATRFVGAVAVVLVSIVAAGLSSIATLASLIFLYVSCLGLVGSNTTAAALERQGERAGVASALLGAGQFATAASASALVGALANGRDGGAWPMAIVMIACAGLAALAVQVGRGTDGSEAEPALP